MKMIVFLLELDDYLLQSDFGYLVINNFDICIIWVSQKTFLRELPSFYHQSQAQICASSGNFFLPIHSNPEAASSSDSASVSVRWYLDLVCSGKNARDATRRDPMPFYAEIRLSLQIAPPCSLLTHSFSPLPRCNSMFYYRVTIPLVQNLQLTSRQKFRFGLARPGQAKPKRNFCLEINWRFCTSGMVTL